MARFPAYKRRAAERQVQAALRPILHRQATRVAMHLRGHPQPLIAAATPDGWWDDGVEEEEVANTLAPILGHAVDAAGFVIAAKFGAQYVRNASAQAQIAAQARTTAQGLSVASRKSLSNLIDSADDEESAAIAVEKWGSRATLARSTAVATVAWAAVQGVMEAGRQTQDQTGVTLTKTWVTTDTPCDECEPNDGEIVGMDESFPSGDDDPPLHENCRCSLELNEEPADEPLTAALLPTGVRSPRIGSLGVAQSGEPSGEGEQASGPSPSYDAPNPSSPLAAASNLVTDPSSEVQMPRRWRSNPAILVEGVETTEMMPRLIDPGVTTWSTMPRDLRVVFEDTGVGHENARTVGRCDVMARNGNLITAEGVFADGDEDADKAVNLVGQRMLQRVSVDPVGGVCVYEMIDPQGNVVPEEIAIELMWDETWDSTGFYVRERWTEFAVGAMTLVSLPAFSDTGIELYEAVPVAIAASAAQDVGASRPVPTEPAGTEEPTSPSPAVEPGGEGRSASPAPTFPRLAALLAMGRGDSLQASAAMRSSVPGAVLRAAVAWDGGPPPGFFAKRTYAGPTPFTISDEGEISGHIAPEGECHVGLKATGVCVTVPRSASEYALFQASGEVRCNDGSRVSVGVITMDMDHAPDGTPGNRPSAAAVLKHHYENTESIVGYVAAFDDEWGVQVHGALREGLSIDRVRRAMAAKPSGDWRDGELLAIVMVPVGAFPVVRYEDGRQYRLVASLSPPRADASLKSAPSCLCQTPAPASHACTCGGHGLPATEEASSTQVAPVADHPELVTAAVPPSQEVSVFAALTRRAELDALDRMMVQSIRPFAVQSYLGSSMTLSERDRSWDGAGAKGRVFDGLCSKPTEEDKKAFDPACAFRAFFYRDDTQDKTNRGAYNLGYCDVIDGKLVAVWKGITAVAAVLQGGRGGTDIPQADQDRIKSVVASWYKKAAAQYDDKSISPPWASAEKSSRVKA